MAEISSEHNKAVSHFAETATASCASLIGAANSLDVAAKAYEAQDEEYYKKFGWVAGKFDDNCGVYHPDQKGGH